MVERDTPSVPGRAGDAHHRPHGHLQRPLCQAAWLHHPAPATGLPYKDRWVKPKYTWFVWRVHFSTKARWDFIIKQVWVSSFILETLRCTEAAVKQLFSFFFCVSEIPLFHVLNARVTFSNLCGCDEAVSSVTVHTPENTEEAGNYDLMGTCLTKCQVAGCSREPAVLYWGGYAASFLCNSSLRSVSCLPLWGWPFGVRAPSRLYRPRSRPQWANEGRGRQPAAVCHPAEPAGRRHGKRSGQSTMVEQFASKINAVLFGLVWTRTSLNYYICIALCMFFFPIVFTNNVFKNTGNTFHIIDIRLSNQYYRNKVTCNLKASPLFPHLRT